MFDDKILKRYLEGKGTQKDQDKIIEWFSGIIHEASLRKASFPVWENSDQGPLLGRDKAESLLDRINHRIRLQSVSDRKETRTAIRYFRILTRIAAILFIPLVIYMWTLRDTIFYAKSDLVYTEIQCPWGTRTMFNLPDGSWGWLNGGSSVKFPIEFRGKKREITMAGEAFFEVQSNPGKPFIVTGDHIQVKAFGTSFNVMAYPLDEVNEVTLVEGKVEVTGKKENKVQSFGYLDPGYMCSFDLATSTYLIKNADVEKAISWKNGKLIFRYDSLKEVVKKCNRWYNVDIILVDKELETHPYVGTFQDETLDEVLKLLTLTAPIEYKDLGRELKEDGTFGKRKIEIRLKK